jgi:hypothetical protein
MATPPHIIKVRRIAVAVISFFANSVIEPTSQKSFISAVSQ